MPAKFRPTPAQKIVLDALAASPTGLAHIPVQYGHNTKGQAPLKPGHTRPSVLRGLGHRELITYVYSGGWACVGRPGVELERPRHHLFTVEVDTIIAALSRLDGPQGFWELWAAFTENEKAVFGHFLTFQAAVHYGANTGRLKYDLHAPRSISLVHPVTV